MTGGHSAANKSLNQNNQIRVYARALSCSSAAGNIISSCANRTNLSQRACEIRGRDHSAITQRTFGLRVSTETRLHSDRRSNTAPPHRTSTHAVSVSMPNMSRSFITELCKRDLRSVFVATPAGVLTWSCAIPSLLCAAGASGATVFIVIIRPNTTIVAGIFLHVANRVVWLCEMCDPDVRPAGLISTVRATPCHS